jgi:hypothetical protein
MPPATPVTLRIPDERDNLLQTEAGANAGTVNGITHLRRSHAGDYTEVVDRKKTSSDQSAGLSQARYPGK